MDTDAPLSARPPAADARPREAAPGVALAVGGAPVVASEVVMLGLETGSVGALRRAATQCRQALPIGMPARAATSCSDADLPESGRAA